MTSKRERFNQTVERMKEYYRKWPTERLRDFDQRGSQTLKEYIVAVREVLKERKDSD